MKNSKTPSQRWKKYKKNFGILNLFLFLAKDPFIFQNALVTKAGAKCQREEEVEVFHNDDNLKSH